MVVERPLRHATECGVPQTPSAEYAARLAARTATRDVLTASDARFAHGRLALVAITVIVAWILWRLGLGLWYLAVPAVVFVWLVRGHDRVLRAREAADRGIAFYQRGLARLADRWVGTGETGERFRGDTHVYANDLDLFGHGSLFQLLSLARTSAGEEMLASWLTAPADPVEIRSRQAAVDELAAYLDLREQLAIAGGHLQQRVQADRLLAWAGSAVEPARAVRSFTWLFTAGLAAALLYLVTTGTWWPLAAGLGLQLLVFRQLRHDIDTIVSGRDAEAAADFVADALTHRTRDLEVVADLLKHLEQQPFRGTRLVALKDRLRGDGVAASAIIGKLQRLAQFHDSTKNTSLIPLGLFLFGYLEAALGVAAVLQMIPPHVALAVSSWRCRHGRRVRVWLETIAEFEALVSLAAYRYERAGDPFPEIVDGAGAPRPPALFEGRRMGHPLLPASSMVPNDVRLGGGTQLLIVSGSNMSGKSTLLRTVGVNAVLALAGAPVRAESLRISPLALGATLRIQDSLLEGRSRFYAEITRIRELSSVAAGPLPLLFLLDELFHGTNSHDRVIGSAGVLRSLLDRGAIGLITTHDLAVTAVADQLSARAANVHFDDWLDGHEIRFDYMMKPGTVTRSNALALMHAVGLDVASPGLGG